MRRRDGRASGLRCRSCVGGRIGDPEGATRRQVGHHALWPSRDSCLDGCARLSEYLGALVKRRFWPMIGGPNVAKAGVTMLSARNRKTVKFIGVGVLVLANWTDEAVI